MHGFLERTTHLAGEEKTAIWDSNEETWVMRSFKTNACHVVHDATIIVQRSANFWLFIEYKLPEDTS